MPDAAIPVINSDSIGNPTRFQTQEHLERTLAALPPAPCQTGRVSLVVRRVEGGLRVPLDRVVMTPDDGLPGDAWGRESEPLLDAQLAVMQLDVAELIANGQPIELSGDNLYLELDLSAENLPTGSRLRVGKALMEVTPQPHNGCRKFRARFGDDALRFVSNPELRHRNLRGIYLRVVESGEVAAGDPVEVFVRTMYDGGAHLQER